MLADLMDRVFQGSREALLMRLMDQRKLTAKERALLAQILKEHQS
jgi:predicted transcriptional regulator